MAHSSDLKTKATRIVGAIPQNPKIAGILLTGSVAKGLADEYSDIELKVMWKEKPTLEDRQQLVADIPTTSELFKEEFVDFEWYQGLIVEGTKVDLYHAEWEEVEKLHKLALVGKETSIDSQLLFSAIIDSVTLRGEVEKLKDEVRQYSAELARECMRVNLIFESWTLRNVLLSRQDYLALNHIIDQTILQIMRLLFALNRTYIRSHYFKWLEYSVNLVERKPADLAGKINAILTTTDFTEKVSGTHALILQTISLVEEVVNGSTKKVADGSAKDNLQLAEDLKYARKILQFVR